MSKVNNIKDKFYKLVFKQTIAQEIANSITHGIGVLLSITAIVLLVVSSISSGSSLKIISFSIYGAALFLVFISSTLYHSLRPFKAKALFLKFDHIAIYFLIAGTYTPLLLLTIGGALGWVWFGIIWGIAIIGTLLNIFFPISLANKISLTIYILMGWLVILFVNGILHKLPLGGFVLLIAGGILYTSGTLFFLSRKLIYSHAIWHLFVIAAAICHFFCIFFYV